MRYVVKQHVYTVDAASAHPIKDEYGRDAYLVDGRAAAPGDRLSFRDRRGRGLAFIRQTLLATVPTFEIYYAEVAPVASTNDVRSSSVASSSVRRTTWYESSNRSRPACNLST